MRIIKLLKTLALMMILPLVLPYGCSAPSHRVVVDEDFWDSLRVKLEFSFMDKPDKDTQTEFLHSKCEFNYQRTFGDMYDSALYTSICDCVSNQMIQDESYMDTLYKIQLLGDLRRNGWDFDNDSYSKSYQKLEKELLMNAGKIGTACTATTVGKRLQDMSPAPVKFVVNEKFWEYKPIDLFWTQVSAALYKNENRTQMMNKCIRDMNSKHNPTNDSTNEVLDLFKTFCECGTNKLFQDIYYSDIRARYIVLKSLKKNGFAFDDDSYHEQVDDLFASLNYLIHQANDECLSEITNEAYE